MAVLTFAIDVQDAEGFNVNTIGIILMAAGALGSVASLVIFGPRTRDTVVEGHRVR